DTVLEIGRQTRVQDHDVLLAVVVEVRRHHGSRGLAHRERDRGRKTGAEEGAVLQRLQGQPRTHRLPHGRLLAAAATEQLRQVAGNGHQRPPDRNNLLSLRHRGPGGRGSGGLPRTLQGEQFAGGAGTGGQAHQRATMPRWWAGASNPPGYGWAFSWT